MENIIKAIKEDILALFQLILEDDKYGTNIKVNINTLKDSNLHNEAKVEESNWVFSLFYNDYLTYIESGRKPKARKVPVDALVEWAKRKGIPSDNNTIYAIRESIYKVGIPKRPIFEPFIEQINEVWDEWSDKIFEGIITNLNNYFNK